MDVVAGIYGSCIIGNMSFILRHPVVSLTVYPWYAPLTLRHSHLQRSRDIWT